LHYKTDYTPIEGYRELEGIAENILQKDVMRSEKKFAHSLFTVRSLVKENVRSIVRHVFCDVQFSLYTSSLNGASFQTIKP
jgi:hypothetical protein